MIYGLTHCEYCGESYHGGSCASKAPDVVVINDLPRGRLTVEEHGIDGFNGDLDSPEAAAYFRSIDGGPETVDHIPRRDTHGWLIDVPDGIRNEDPAGYLRPTAGRLIAASIPDGFGFALLSMGDIFRGPDHHHYQPIHGIADSRDRSDALHWLSGLAPVELSSDARIVELHDFGTTGGVLCIYVGDPNWPR